jgi:uncharacterized protein (TIGR02246 family)
MTVSAADMAQLAAVPQRIVAAWAKNDAEEFASIFVEDGILVLPGVLLHSRAEIRDYMAAGFAGPYKDTKVTGQPVEARTLGPGSAVVVTEGGVLAPGESTVAPERAIRAFWVLVQQDGGWALASYMNTPSAKQG